MKHKNLVSNKLIKVKFPPWRDNEADISSVGHLLWRRTNAWNARGSFLESPEKLFVKLRPAYSVKLVFSYVVKGIKIKITAKFQATRRLRFEDTKRITCHPKCSGKVSGLSRNGPQLRYLFTVKIWPLPTRLLSKFVNVERTTLFQCRVNKEKESSQGRQRPFTVLNKFKCYTFLHWSEKCLQYKSVWKLYSHCHLKIDRTEVTTKILKEAAKHKS